MSLHDWCRQFLLFALDTCLPKQSKFMHIVDVDAMWPTRGHSATSTQIGSQPGISPKTSFSILRNHLLTQTAGQNQPSGRSDPPSHTADLPGDSRCAKRRRVCQLISLAKALDPPLIGTRLTAKCRLCRRGALCSKHRKVGGNFNATRVLPLDSILSQVSLPPGLVGPPPGLDVATVST